VIKASGQHSYPVITLGSSNDVQVGQPVVALGAPLGLSSTVTSGIVSALDRTVAVPADDGKTALLVSAVQTDAAINPGNSGGALVNCAAELVGVPTAGATVPSPTGQSSPGSIGLGFAIPVDLAKAIADELIATGTVTHSFFGVQVAAIPPQVAEEAGVRKGLFVQGAVSGGPAASAGLRVGDIVTNIDGQPATDPNQLAAIELTKKPGDSVSIGYERSGHASTTTVVLGSQP
jgi:putative serine protease PepD